jgi:hypothetical protein
MLRGALAMFDALGFKGIWRPPDVSRPEDVVDKLKRMQASLDGYLHRTFGGADQPILRDPSNMLRSVHTMFLSDTVAVAVVPKTLDQVHEKLRATVSEDLLAASAVAYASTLSGEVMRDALSSSPIWAYRGCIAYGDFYMEDRFVVGEAVDEAAEHMNSADGAFVWLAPSARDAFEKHPGGFGGRCTPLARYLVPRNEDPDQAIQTFVASPFPWQAHVDEAMPVVDALKRTFGNADSARVRHLAKNTHEFLRVHLSDLVAEYDELERRFGWRP